MNYLSCILAFCAAPAFADIPTLKTIVEGHILPRFEAVADTTDVLAQAAANDCRPKSSALQAAYRTAFDAWISASHLRFGPTEEDDRGFALAFWPDGRGATPRSLSNLIANEDPIALSATSYADVSIAARGFYALEFLLYDETLMAAGTPEYHCALVQTVAKDIAATSASILAGWQGAFLTQILKPSQTGRYRTVQEALQSLFKALTTGLQFSSEVRLGRPLGTFDRPRPKLAEARRSGRSARHVRLSLVSLRDFAILLCGDNPALAKGLQQQFDATLSRLADMDDPKLAGVGTPQSRLRIEIIQHSVEAIRVDIEQRLGRHLGVIAGFNSLDGD
jgi:predicted lipoprotein